MRWLPLAVLLLAVPSFPLALPSFPAQPLPESIEGTDPGGDVEILAPDGTVLGTTAQFPYVDVLAGAVRKGTSGHMAFDLQVADPTTLWDEPTASMNLGQRVATHFIFGGVHYYVDFAWFPREGCLQRVVGPDSYDHVQCVDATLTNGVFQAEIPSTVITDLAGAILRHPAQLDEVWAEGFQDVLFLPNGNVRLRDLAPDDGAWGSLRTPIDPGAGPLLLNPIQRLLGSNGGPAVLAFQLVADNIATTPLDVLLTVEGLPVGWSARIPARIHLEASETRTLPLLVTIPGAHAHGETLEFAVNAQPLGFDGVSRDLAVHFFTVPQPAGHHPDLYLHSATGQAGIYSWMDTIQDHPDDERLPIESFFGRTDLVAQTSTDLFIVDMVPTLGIGLDFDITRAVAAKFALDTDLPRDAVVSARLEHCNPADFAGRSYEEYGGDIPCPGTWLRLVEFASADLAMGVNEFDVDMAVTGYADLVPPQFNSALAFIVEVTQPLASPPGGITILPGGSRFALPLHEYQPALGKDAALGSLGLAAVDGTERLVGPGSTAWTILRLSNAGDEARDILLDVVGHNAAWASVEPTSLTLAAGGSVDIFVRLDVPADAIAQEFAQFYVIASVEGDDNLVALAPLRFTVTEGGDIRSDPDPRPESKGQGAAGPSLALVAIALLALALRRR